MKTLKSEFTTIQILNESYQIINTAHSTANLREVTEYIEKKVREVGKSSGETNSSRLLMRATLEIAMDLLRLQKHQQIVLAHTQEHLDRLGKLVAARTKLIDHSSQWLTKVQPHLSTLNSNITPQTTKQLPPKSRRSFHHN